MSDRCPLGYLLPNYNKILLSDITTEQEVETITKITLNIPQNLMETTELSEKVKSEYDMGSITEQDKTYTPMKSETNAVDQGNPGMSNYESHVEYNDRNNESDTSSITSDHADMKDIANIEQSAVLAEINGEQEGVDTNNVKPKRKRGRPRKYVDGAYKETGKWLETTDMKSSTPQKQQRCKTTLEDFKTLVRDWLIKRDTEPDYFAQNVSYGSWLKPIEKPHDLDEDFFSKSQNGYYCCNCSLLFKGGVKVFIKHRTKTDGKCYYECDICEKKYCRESEMLVHRKYHTNIKSHVCEFCSAAFKKKDRLNTHIQQHHKTDTAYVCNICQKAFKTQPCLYAHMRNVHVEENEKLLCSFCPKSFKTNASLKYHLLSHSDEITCNWPCEKCGKTFRLEKLLKNHVKRHSQERKFCCRVCGKSFYKLYHLKNHAIIHSGLKPFECNVCSYKCNIKWNLDKHMKIHLKQVFTTDQ